jgi:YegS/Rv2252/BmrU family lipid kinase
MKPNGKYLIIVNPISGDKDKSGLLEKIKLFFEDSKSEWVIYETTGEKDIEAIQQLFFDNKPERVVVAGGDGTIKMVVEALENEDVIYGLIPAGSANGFATDLNIPTENEDALRIAFHNPYTVIDIVEINGMKSLHLSDIGLNALLVKNYENSDSRGKIGYLQQVIPTLKEADDAFKISIEADSASVKCDAKMVVFANSQKYGTGVVINPIGVIDDGKFEIIILKNLDLLVIAKIMTGNVAVSDEDIHIISTTSAKINLEKPVSFQMDGEYCGKVDSLSIKISNNKIKVATP